MKLCKFSKKYKANVAFIVTNLKKVKIVKKILNSKFQ